MQILLRVRRIHYGGRTGREGRVQQLLAEQGVAAVVVVARFVIVVIVVVVTVAAKMALGFIAGTHALWTVNGRCIGASAAAAVAAALKGLDPNIPGML